MAVQGGVWYFDGRPTEDACRALADSLRPLAPSGLSTIAENGVVMASGGDAVWTHDASGQPIRSNIGLIITFDGRLDNRDDLLLRLHGRLCLETSDAEIALEVFERWGIDGLHDLVGDWSLVLWNSRTRTLHLARDYMGVRPLCYHVDRDRVMWSTSLGELAIRAGRVDQLVPEFVARFMALQFSTDITPYEGIRAAPTGACVTLSQLGTEQRSRFWSLAPGFVRYRQRGQYEEHLRALWTDAVGSRLRTQGMVWAELSGGLDSSAVVCMADALVRSGRCVASDMQPVSYVTMNSIEGDERRFVAAVEAQVDRRAEVLGVEAHADDADSDWEWVSPLAPSGVKVRTVQLVRQSGCRVVLSGRMGDVTMGYIPDNSAAVLDDVVECRLAVALVKMRHWSRASKKPFAAVAWGLLRDATAGTAVRRAFDRSSRIKVGTVLAGDVLSADVEQPAFERAIGIMPLAQRAQARRIFFYAHQARLESWSEPRCVAHVHPFAHRPLVEFMMSIPSQELSEPGTTRPLMRRALTGLVPAKVLSRTSKGYYPPAALREARRQISALPPVDRFESVQRGWVDASRLQAAIAGLLAGHIDPGSSVHLVLRLERWLASRHRRGPAVIPTGKEVTTNDVRIA